MRLRIRTVVVFASLASLAYIEPHSGYYYQFDITGMPLEKTVTDAHTNMSINCPGFHEQLVISNIQWQRGDTKLLEYGNRATTVWESSDRLHLLVPSFRLAFSPVLAADDGIYFCIINNRRYPEGVAELVVRDVPDPPGSPMTLGFLSRSVNLSWTPPMTDNHSPITNYIIQIMNKVGGEWGWDIKTPDSSTFYTITGLTPFSEYAFRVIAENAYGLSPPSSPTFFMLTLREAEDVFTVETLVLLNERAIEGLIPKAGPRALFEESLRVFKEEQRRSVDNSFNISGLLDSGSISSPRVDDLFSPFQLHHTFTPTPSTSGALENVAQTPEPPADSEVALSNLVGDSVDAQEVLSACLLAKNKNQPFSDHVRKALCDQIIRKLTPTCPGARDRVVQLPTPASLCAISETIEKLFPCERASLYFQSGSAATHFTSRRNIHGDLVTARERRKGFLAGLDIPLRCSRSSSSSSSRRGSCDTLVALESLTQEDAELVDSKLAELRRLNDASDWVFLSQLWEETKRARLYKVFKEIGSVQAYLDEFPVLKGPNGWQLLLKDFASIYSGCQDGLKAATTYAQRIIEFGRTAAAKTKDLYTKNGIKTIIDSLVEDEASVASIATCDNIDAVFDALAAAPDGKPSVTAAFNVSSSSVLIIWEPPLRSTYNGEFRGYKLALKERLTNKSRVILINNPNIKSFTFHNLKPYTQYMVCIEIINPEGIGPPTAVLVLTDEGEPGEPANIQVLNATGTTFYIIWSEPKKPNGVIRGYRIYYVHDNLTDVQSSPSPRTSFILRHLRPFTLYKVFVKAYSLKHEGLPSDPIEHMTDIAGPEAPVVTNATCQTNLTLYFEWLRPSIYFFGVDEYTILFRPDGTEEYDQRSFIPDNREDPGPFNIVLLDLEEDAYYDIKVFGLSRSVSDPSILVPGVDSKIQRVFIKLDCEKPDPSLLELFLSMPPAIIGFVLVVGAALFFGCCFCLWRKCVQARISARRRPNGFCQADKDNAIAMREFPQHVASMHADGDLGFSKEYEEIQHDDSPDTLTAHASQHPDNKLKNRYLNILAYDHTRVQFLPLPDQENSNTEYINANYIDGFAKQAAYIGTQGPLPATFAAFWQMVWEQNVYIIIMITNLIERGRRKCDMYWPKEDTDIHGNISVTLEKEDSKATYTVRVFRLRYLRSDKKKKSPERLVYHYHYTNWPDHGTPDHALPILRFITKSSDANPPDGGPIVVHCSAGVGRTGAYIVLDTMLKMIKYNKQVDVFSFLKHIRTQRNYLVQTEEQYIFLHDALVEAIECGETYIHQSYIQKYLNSLISKSREANSLAGVSLEDQFKLGTSFTPMDYHSISSCKSMNVPKNGSNPIIPMECFRVHLTPKPGLEGSDYVNASWFVGYYRLHEFIVAGAPCEYSLIDFWQIMWDHSVRTAAIFIDFENEENVPFWPLEGQVLNGETYKLSLIETGNASGVVFRDFSLRAVSEEYEWTLRIFFCPKWPHSCSPIVKTFDAIYQVLDWNKEHNGPIALIDHYGTTQAATFCLLATVLRQLTEEGFADIFTYFKLYHIFRPGCWQSPSDLRLLYEAVAALVKKLPPSKVPVVAPYPPGTGPTPNITVNGKPRSYIRCRGNSASLDSIEDGLVTPEMESLYPSALQEPSVTELVAETNVHVELVENDIPEMLEEEEEEECSEGLAEDAV